MKHSLGQFSRIFVCAVFCFASIIASAVPTISDVRLGNVAPLGILIDFTVSGATADDEALVLAVSFIDGGVTYNAQHLSGSTKCVNGVHRVIWRAAKDGLEINASFPSPDSLWSMKYEYALYCVLDLSGGPTASSYPVTYLSAPPSGGFNTDEYKTTKLVLKRVDAGSFVMGDNQSDESHRVTLTQPFYMGLYEVTQRQWELVTGSDPCSSTSYGKGNAYPVYYVFYDEIRGSSKWPASNEVDSSSFFGKLRARTGLDFDLPTEAQWEYACRAGTTTAFSYGNRKNGAYMWYESNSSGRSHEVGTKKPNPWGFYDMHGNVWEWCLDGSGPLLYGMDPWGSFTPDSRMLRGGSWRYADLCTSSFRNSNNPSIRIHSPQDFGFRISRTLPRFSK